MAELRFLGSLFVFALIPVLAVCAADPPRSIRVVVDDNYPPYAFRDDEGELQGILIDEWRLWEKTTGITVELRGANWADALLGIKAGEFDVIDPIFKTPGRMADFDFTKPYATIDVPVYFHKDVSGIVDAMSLRGFAVATKTGDAAEEMLRQNGVHTLLSFDNYEEIVAAAMQHKVNVFVIDEPPARYFISKLGIQDDFRQSVPISTGEFRRAVRKGEAGLLQTVESGFDAMSQRDLDRIREKWYGMAISGHPNLRSLGSIAAAALLLILCLFIWNRLLRRLVNSRTAALTRSESRLRGLLEEVQRANRQLRMLSDCNLALIRAADETELLRTICQIVVDIGGYRMAWVGLAENDEQKTVRPVAQAGFEEGYLQRADISWADNERGRGPTGTAIRTCKPCQARDVSGDTTFAPWREEAMKRRYASSLSVPLVSEGKIFGALNIYSAATAAFNDTETALLTELASDMGFGVTLLRARSERRRAETALAESEQKLRSIFENAPVGILQARANRFLRANAALARMFGYASPQLFMAEVTDIAAQLFVHPKQVRVLVGRALAARGFINHEMDCRRRDGSVFTANVHVRAVRGEQGEPAFIEGFAEDITERKRAEQRLQQSREQLRALSSRLQSLREEERTRLAREIHDHLGQLLTALKLDLRLLERKLPAVADPEMRSASAHKLASALELTDEVISSVQKLASELRPGILDRLGLGAAIEAETQAFQSRTGIDCEWMISKDLPALSPDQATSVFRIFQELLTNIARHARASRATATLDCVGGDLLLDVADDGIGIEPDQLEHPQSLGLLGMQERAAMLGGSIAFSRNAGQGTRVTVRIPLDRKTDHETDSDR